MAGLRGDQPPPMLTWRPGDPGPRPGFGGTGEDLRYMQGTVVHWNPDTAENTIKIRGVDHVNVPLIDLAVGQRAILPGDQVAIMAWSPNGGTAAYFIMGRLVVPGSQAAERSAEILQQQTDDMVEQLLTSPAGILLAQFVIAQTVGVDSVVALQSTTSTSYTDLSTPGPAVTVNISDAGKATALLSADIGASASQGGFVALELSGANTESAPAGDGSLSLVAGSGSGVASGMTKAITFEGLNPGETTFTAKYRSGAGGSINFNQRNLTVLAM